MSDIEISSSGNVLEIVNNEIIINVSQTGSPGVGVPAGGTTGQALVKASDTNYDTEWVDVKGSSVDVVAIAGQTVSALKIVYIDPVTSKILYADKNDLSTISTILGVTTQAGSLDDNINVVTSGVISDSNWNWNMAGNLNLFLGANGAIVQGVPVGAVSVRIGNAMSTTEILVRIGESILTA